VVGGLRIGEPAADLATALAMVSSLRDAPVKPGSVAVGEIGLSGELRPVGQLDRRLSEAANMGFRVCLLPEAAAQRAAGPQGLELRGARTIREAVRAALGPRRAAPPPEAEW